MPDILRNLQSSINNTRWSPLGEGSFNKAFLSGRPLTIGGYTGLWVLKKPKNKHKQFACNDIDRAIRKWRLHNPEYPAFRTQDGWLVPYLGNTPAYDRNRNSASIG